MGWLSSGMKAQLELDEIRIGTALAGTGKTWIPKGK
jgi:phosphate starvation-inducible protein PhoH